MVIVRFLNSAVAEKRLMMIDLTCDEQAA